MRLEQYPDILTIDEVSEILKIGRNQCYNLLNTGRLRGFKTGKKTWKIPKAAIVYFLKIEFDHFKYST